VIVQNGFCLRRFAERTDQTELDEEARDLKNASSSLATITFPYSYSGPIIALRISLFPYVGILIQRIF
jgi:hypothetical protein